MAQFSTGDPHHRWLSFRPALTRESTSTDSRDLAEEKRVAREATAYREELHGVKPTKSFAEAVLSYLKRQQSDDTKRRLNRFLGFLKSVGKQNIGCDQVGQVLLDGACEALLRPGSSGSTRLREVVSPVRAVLRHAAVRGWCSLPVFETIRQGKRRKEWLTPDEATAIVAASPSHLKPIFEFMFCAGLRRGETLSLDWKICPAQVRPGHAAGRQVSPRRREGPHHRARAARCRGPVGAAWSSSERPRLQAGRW